MKKYILVCLLVYVALTIHCSKFLNPIEIEEDPYKDCLLVYPANADTSYWVCPNE